MLLLKMTPRIRFPSQVLEKQTTTFVLEIVLTIIILLLCLRKGSDGKQKL